jgi:hypothetical protein
VQQVRYMGSMLCVRAAAPEDSSGVTLIRLGGTQQLMGSVGHCSLSAGMPNSGNGDRVPCSRLEAVVSTGVGYCSGKATVGAPHRAAKQLVA